MKRRAFIQLLTAIAGAAALPTGLAKSLPADIPDDWLASIGSCDADGEFQAYQTARLERFAGANKNAIIFEEHHGPSLVRLTHICAAGYLIKLHNPVTVNAGIRPIFPVGALTIEEN